MSSLAILGWRLRRMCLLGIGPRLCLAILEGCGQRCFFSELLSRCQNYDYVFFDVSPSLGAINRSVLIACDYFLSPMSVDIFSLRALENIATALESWSRQLARGLEENPDPEDLPIKNYDWRLRFAGYVSQQYIAKRDSEGNQRPVAHVFLDPLQGPTPFVRQQRLPRLCALDGRHLRCRPVHSRPEVRGDPVKIIGRQGPAVSRVELASFNLRHTRSTTGPLLLASGAKTMSMRSAML